MWSFVKDRFLFSEGFVAFVSSEFTVSHSPSNVEELTVLMQTYDLDLQEQTERSIN